MEALSPTWPLDPDGDVFRRLAEQQFDFNVDFVDWPPSKAALAWLRQAYPTFEVHEPSGEFDGYVLVQLTGRLTYDLVMSTQRRITEAMAAHGGSCESWGVLHGPAQ
jgi:hypothetical protein